MFFAYLYNVIEEQYFTRLLGEGRPFCLLGITRRKALVAFAHFADEPEWLSEP